MPLIRKASFTKAVSRLGGLGSMTRCIVAACRDSPEATDPPSFTWQAKAFFLAVVIVTVLGTNASADLANVLASRYDNERTGANLKETLLTPENVNPDGFGKLFTYDLSYDGTPGGDVYAQPLYVSHVGIPERGVVNLLLVATTNNVVFALDADGPKSGSDGVFWSRSLGMPPSIDDVWKNCTIASPCPFFRGDNIRGNVGTMSTPVIDRSRGIVFVVSRILQAPGHIVYQLHALDLLRGNDRVGSPIEIKAKASGVDFVADVENQRTGIALSQGQVIISWGGHADFLRYHGWVLSYRYDDNGFTQTGALVTTPDGDTRFTCAIGNVPYAANNCAHGGIWMSGRAPAVDAQGNILLIVGNGRNDMSATATRNFGNSLLKLDPVSLTVLDFFTPENHLMLNAADLDLGGSGPMIIPGSNFIVGGGKQGVMHVWRLDNLGKFSPGDPLVVQKFPAGIVKDHIDTGNDHPGGAVIGGVIVSRHAGHIMGGPVFWPRSQTIGGSRLFNWSENSELRAYAVNLNADQPIAVTPVALGPDIQEGHPGGILTLSAHGEAASSGIVWAATYDASGTFVVGLGPTGALNKIRPGFLRAYSAEDLTPLWNSEQNPDRDRLGDFAKFTPPTVANGRVYMATFSGKLVVYGLLRHNYVRPAAALMTPPLKLLLDDDDGR